MTEENNILNKKTGNNDQPKGTVSPAKVTITSVTIKEKDKDGNQMKTPLAQFLVKHPEKDELLNITKVKFLDGEKLKVQGFWVQTDEESNFFKGSSIDRILKILNCETLADTYGKEIDTVTESENSPYLCLKAY